MDKNYLDYLENQFKEANTMFEEAKAKAIKDIENITAWNAADFGAAYYTKIDKITQAGERLITIANALRVYKYYLENEEQISL